MPETLGYNEAMGSLEAHQALMKTRVDNAEAGYKRALERNISREAIEAAKQVWEAAQEQYQEFITGAKHGDKEVDSETIIH